MSNLTENKPIPILVEELFLKNKNIPVKTGKFQAMMNVELINDGPVTFWLEK